jgi:hypothetical protein
MENLMSENDSNERGTKIALRFLLVIVGAGILGLIAMAAGLF